MTGVNPGKHRVYGFTRLEPSNGYTVKVNSGAIRRAPTIWQLLTAQGRRSIVINVPMTYPPDPIDGLVITGIDTPGLASQFTYPPEFRHEVFRIVPDYLLDIRRWGVTAVGQRREQMLEDILRMLESRRQLALHLLATQPWDLFTAVFTATDRAQHFFWRFLDPTHPLHDPADAPKYHDAILRVYRHVDETVGEMLTHCAEETTVIVMSDHGFGPQHKLFRINQWLVKNGFLELTCSTGNSPAGHLLGAAQRWSYYGLDRAVMLVRSALPDTAKDRLKRLFPHLREQVASNILFTGVDWSKTKAYHTAEFPGSVRVNLQGREVTGSIGPGAEYEAVCEAIRSGLEGYVDPDSRKRVVERVLRREELYWGPFQDEAPDLIVDLADYAYTIDWYVPVSRDGSRSDLPIIDALTGAYAANCGSHRLDGILMLCGADIQRGVQLDPARVYDVTPTVLYLMGLPVPTYVDGQVLTEGIRPALLERRSIERSPTTYPVADKTSSRQDLSEAEAEIVANRLRDLGYL
jgi:predicted AlkP superfamily phosphohydrolase/phosphomutase